MSAGGGGGGCHQTVIVNIMRERTANELIYQISHQNDIHITVDETAGKLTKCETFSFHLQINWFLFNSHFTLREELRNNECLVPTGRSQRKRSSFPVKWIGDLLTTCYGISDYIGRHAYIRFTQLDDIYIEIYTSVCNPSHIVLHSLKDKYINRAETKGKTT